MPYAQQGDGKSNETASFTLLHPTHSTETSLPHPATHETRRETVPRRLHCDQRPNSKNLNHWTTFLHQDTAYSIGGEEIGKRINAHYFYLDVEKVSRGYYKMSFIPIIPQRKNEAHPYTLQYMRMMEATITRAPQYWLWSHKRWRFPKSDNKTII